MQSKQQIFYQGTTTVRCSATDSAGNTGYDSFTVTVSRPDTTPPTVNVPDDITTTTSSHRKYISYSVSATDNIDNSPSVTCNPSSKYFYQGTTTVRCSATDSAGNTGYDSFTVTVSRPDTTPPTVNVPDDITTTTSSNGKYISYSVSATDNIDNSPSVTCNPSSKYFYQGTTTVRCSATDSAGNTGMTALQ